MKKIITLALLLGVTAISFAQTNPVSWKFTAKKIADKTYEVHLTATMESGWLLYSQTQPEDAIAMPTTFKFTANPLLTMDGAVKEKGKMEKFHDAKLGASANQYSKTVDFVQVVKVKSNVKTSLLGELTFQTCDDKKCLPPKKVPFNIPLG